MKLIIKNTIKHSLLMLSLLSVFALSAQATLIETHGGLELEASMVTLPSNSSGSISIRECDDCDRITLKTNEATTRFVIRNSDGSTDTVSLKQFAAEMRMIDNRDAMVLVFYKLDTQTVTEANLISKSGSGKTGKPARNKQNDTSATQRNWK